jgi:alpha-L-fucosidase
MPDYIDRIMNAHRPNRRSMLRSLAGSPLLLRNPLFAAPEDDSRTKWFREAKFGMFVHWGPYSLSSVEASWPIMVPPRDGHAITEAEYRALPNRFNPAQFDAVAWVRLARAAGQRYMVFTSKHHDGFCMFDSSYTNYKITRTPYGKDIVKQLADACEGAGMRLGFYYSPPDMNHPAFRDTSKLTRENWNGQPERPEWPLYLDYMGLQLTELLTRYGDAAIIWFDGLSRQEQYDGRRFLRLIHELQPATLVNNRIGLPADYETPEQFIPKSIPTKNVRLSGIDPSAATALQPGVPQPEDFRLWETCMTINNTWAYNRNDQEYKSANFLVRSLVEVASRGGNLLLNVGPTAEGTIQPEFQERLLAIGRWLDRHGEAIYGTTYGPIQGLEDVRTTAKGRDVYVHVMKWKPGALELPGQSLPKFRAALVVGTGGELPMRQEDRRVVLDLPATAPDQTVSVVALRAA